MPLAGERGFVEAAIEKISGRFMEQRELTIFDILKVDGAAAAGQPGNALALDPTPVGKELKADERGIARKCRRAGIGRVAIAGWAKRQHLPHMLFGARQKGYKLVRGRAQVADAAIRGQRGYMQQDPGGTLKLHDAIIAGDDRWDYGAAGGGHLLRHYCAYLQRTSESRQRSGRSPLTKHFRRSCICIYALVSMLAILAPDAFAAPTAPQPMVLATGWQLQDVAKVPQPGAQVAAEGFDTKGWYAATVPGTVLTTLVNNHVYPEPLYGENDRPEIIPESLVHTSYWYRTDDPDSAHLPESSRLAQL